MKKLIRFALLSALLSIVYGCASDYNTFVGPSDEINKAFMEYKALPGQKVFVVAFDPNGPWAYGYADSCATIEEAAKAAAIACDKHRKENQVLNKAKVFAINNDIVYYKKLKKSR